MDAEGVRNLFRSLRQKDREPICFSGTCASLQRSFLFCACISLNGLSKKLIKEGSLISVKKQNFKRTVTVLTVSVLFALALSVSAFAGGIADVVSDVNSAVNNVVWGWPAMILILGTGIILTLRNRGVQFLHFGHAMKNTIGKITEKKEVTDKGAVTPFQAVCTALAATVGTGNIAGVAGAIAIGGPGAVFWMWVSALLGMATKFSEVVLSIKFRERNKNGDWVGGPMYYIQNGLGKGWKWLSVVFCICGVLASFGIGNMTQVNTIAGTVNTAIKNFTPTNEFAVRLAVGIIIAIIIALVSIGGIKRIGKVSEMIVPIMSVIYIVASLVIIIVNIDQLGNVLKEIVTSAFSVKASVGGVAGITIATAMKKGISRGIFSNEAGLGSAPIAHAAADTDNAVKQGLFGVFEVFADTIVICTMTALTILMSGVVVPYGGDADASLSIEAFSTVFDGKTAGVVVAIALALFAFTTISSWNLYGTRCMEYLFGEKAATVYKIVFLPMLVIGATMSLDLAWAIADTLNGMMAIPNLIALLLLSGVVAKETKAYFASVKAKKAEKKTAK